MSNKKKNEASTTAGIKGALGGAGFPMARKQLDPEAPIKKINKPSNEDMSSIKDRPIYGKPNGEPIILGEKEPTQEEIAAFQHLLNDEDVEETVRKSGESWIYYDDDSGLPQGTFKHRKDAWNKQRLARKSKGKEVNEPTSESKKKHLIKLFKESVRRVLSEASVFEYIFEQSPASEDSMVWDTFLQNVSKQTIFSDKTLKTILKKGAIAEKEILVKAVKEIEKALNPELFTISVGKLSQDEDKNLVLDFGVKLEGSKKFKFAVKLENGRPLIQFPEETRMELNSMQDDSGKRLRAELMHCQETVLDEMHEVVNYIEERNQYLNSMKEELDQILADAEPLQLVMLKFLMKQKYKEVK